MNKHSPGPWTVEDDEQYPHAFARIKGPAMSLSWPKYASDLTPEQSRQREIDANLIAAAPDLLEALKGLFSIANAEGVVGDDTTIPAALAAISKAEGWT